MTRSSSSFNIERPYAPASARASLGRRVSARRWLPRCATACRRGTARGASLAFLPPSKTTPFDSGHGGSVGPRSTREPQAEPVPRNVLSPPLGEHRADVLCSPGRLE
jgi:hypothetical protein